MLYKLFEKQMSERVGTSNATSILAGLTTMSCGVAEVVRTHEKAIRHRSQITEETLQESTTA